MSTPQRLSTGRIVLGKQRRQAVVARQVANHKVALAAHLSAGLALPRAADVLAAARSQIGKPYSIASCRCDESCFARDCSGLIDFALNHEGYPHICTSSFGFAQIGRDHGSIIPKDRALWTPAAIGIRNPFGGPNFNGSNGHVWFCVGDGVHSIEEGGHATGCYEGDADKLGDVIFMLIPGVDYSAFKIGDETMVLQPGRHGALGNTAFVRLAADGSHVELWWGASVNADQPTATDHLRTWTPSTLPGGVRLVGLAGYEKTPEDGTPGIVVSDENGKPYRGHWS